MLQGTGKFSPSLGTSLGTPWPKENQGKITNLWIWGWGSLVENYSIYYIEEPMCDVIGMNLSISEVQEYGSHISSFSISFPLLKMLHEQQELIFWTPKKI